jgi:hypothetical protein
VGEGLEMDTEESSQRISGLDWVRSGESIETFYNNSRGKRLFIALGVISPFAFFCNPLYPFTRWSGFEKISFSLVFVIFIAVLTLHAFSVKSIYADRKNLIFRRKIFGFQFSKVYRWGQIKSLRKAEPLLSTGQETTYSIKIETDRKFDTLLYGSNSDFLDDVLYELNAFHPQSITLKVSAEKSVSSPLHGAPASSAFVQQKARGRDQKPVQKELVLPSGRKRVFGIICFGMTIFSGFQIIFSLGHKNWNDHSFIAAFLGILAVFLISLSVGVYFCLVDRHLLWDDKKLRIETRVLSYKKYKEYRLKDVYGANVREEHSRYGTSYYVMIHYDGDWLTIASDISERNAYVLTDQITAMLPKVS